MDKNKALFVELMSVVRLKRHQVATDQTAPRAKTPYEVGERAECTFHEDNVEAFVGDGTDDLVIHSTLYPIGDEPKHVAGAQVG
jgi:hypothetical protein